MTGLRARLKSAAQSSAALRKLTWRLGRLARARGHGYFDWSRAISPADRAAVAAAAGGRRVLIATSVGAYLPGMAGEGLLGAALARRGNDVHYLLCDEILPACLDCELRLEANLARFAARGPKDRHCASCFPPGLANYSKIGASMHRYSDWLRARDIEDAEALVDGLPQASWGDLTIDGVHVGDHAKAGLLRFLARGTLAGSADETTVLRRYMIAGMLTLRIAQRLLREEKFDVVVLHHGIYIPQGIIAEVARTMGVRVVTWNVGYRRNCLLFSHDETYHHAMMDEPVSAWRQMRWGDQHERFIEDYLKSRWYGTNDWIWFHDRPTFDLKPFAALTGFDPMRPAIGLLTNVFWDAQLHYPRNVFHNMLEWIFETVDYFSKRPELQLLIRVHPAEIRGTVPARERVADALMARYATLPPNIILVGPDNNISTYPLMEACDSVIIYGTKTGVELTSMGIPVIVAGEAWIKNKGLTLDPATREEYLALLDTLPLRRRMDPEQVALARRYAFHFFFRRMIPVPFLKPGTGLSPIDVELDDLDKLAEGADRGLDVICRGILEGSPFIYPQEDLLAPS